MRVAPTMLAVLIAGTFSACGSSGADQKQIRPPLSNLQPLATPRRPASSADILPTGRGGCASRGKRRPTCRVLFVGNSYSYVNELPSVFQELAHAGNHAARVGLVADPGQTLVDHVDSRDAADAVQAGDWNIVVLQEQSQIPASGSLRRADMYPAARQLSQMIRTTGAEPMLFLTWARREGWPAAGLASYSAMQAAVDLGYLTLGRALHVSVAPVGIAWAATLASERHPKLWGQDGSHPTIRGTYLAACVFYATIFRESPVGLRYHGGLTAEAARKLQTTASRVVLSHPVE